jgi:hypothetical protein
VTYQIATRGEVTADLDGFAAEVASALRDPRGWRAAGIVFEAVESASDITIWLVEDGSVPSFSRACSVLYSCSVGRNIVVNQSRWLQGAPAGALDGVELSQYRVMVVNHEVGHWLGHHRHSACPGEGQIAPLMMQQSKGTDGCLFNPYPLDSELTAPDLFR